MLKFRIIKSEDDFNTPDEFKDYVEFLFVHLDQFGDSREAITKCMNFAFEKDGGLGGFCLMAYNEEEKLVGELIINNTGMTEYIPDHILVYVAVDSQFRGKGYGGEIIKKAAELCEGDMKLHVEYENPAKRLYERLGFTNKYAEMRLTKEK